MSGLFKDIIQENDKRPYEVCGLIRFLDTLDTEDRNDLEKAIADPSITATAIERALKKNGYKMLGSMIRRHRRKECACGPTC